MIWVLLWYLSGILSILVTILIEGSGLKLNEVGESLFVAAFGPLILILFLFEFLNDSNITLIKSRQVESNDTSTDR